MNTNVHNSGTFLLYLLILCFMHVVFFAEAQVTIGSNNEPVKGALLELKTRNANNPPQVDDDENITSTKGGLLLPRVKLVSLSTLQPFISANDSDWRNNIRTRIKEKHAGLTVYNLSNNANFKPGIYTWNGDQWISVGSSELFFKNALKYAQDSVLLGGTLLSSTTINTGNYSLNLTDSGQVTVSNPVIGNGAWKYTHGVPGEGKILMTNSSGDAIWNENTTVPIVTPRASFSPTGIDVNLGNYQNSWANTGTYIDLPPGRWFVIVTMRSNVLNADKPSRFWIKSTFIKDGDKEPDPSYFISSNNLISGAVYDGSNVISGYVIIENSTATPIRFNYHVGYAGIIYGSRFGSLERFGSYSWQENSIVAFALVE